MIGGTDSFFDGKLQMNQFSLLIPCLRLLKNQSENHAGK
jgi:hypothetical protein